MSKEATQDSKKGVSKGQETEAVESPAESQASKHSNTIDTIAEKRQKTQEANKENMPPFHGMPDIEGTRHLFKENGEPSASEGVIPPADTGEDTPKDLGLTEQESFNELPKDPNSVPEELANTELGEYIVMQEGKPFVKLKVDGKEVEVPFDKALQQMQKHSAADKRLQEAAIQRKDVEAREKNVRENEQAFMSNMQKQSSPPESQATDVDDQTLLEQAKGIVEDIVDDENAAAAKLVDFFKQVQSGVAPQPEVDTQAIVDEAVNKVRETFSAEDQAKDDEEARISFKNDYPDVFANDAIYKVVDALSTQIFNEHPEWTTREILEETGRVARETKLSKAQTSQGDNPTPNANTPANVDIGRQNRKEQLVVMPRKTNASQGQPAAPERQSSSDAILQMRKARGLSY